MSDQWQSVDHDRDDSGPVDVVSGDDLEANDDSFDNDTEDVFVLDEAPDPDSVLAVWEPTGHADVDAALEQLHELTNVELDQHAGVFERVEASLRQTLNGLAAEDESA